ncbi:MAG: pilus assembly protein [Acidobacteria bacterium]|nr:pilus assembly protein [Acidobacteriota bacterium]
MTKPASTRPRQRGNAMIEFGIAMAVLFPILAGTFQYGYSYFVYNNLESSVRAAARYAATRTYDSGTATPSAAFAASVRNMALYGDPAGGTVTVPAGLTPGNVTVQMTFSNGVPSRVTVAISGYQINGVFGNLTLNGKPMVSFPYVGSWDPV